MPNTLARTPTRLALPALLLVIAAAASAQQVPAEPQQQEHIVRRGDTLWDLARTYLSNPFRWPLIFEANRHVVEDPHWIYPSERLIIPPLLQTARLDPLPIGVEAADEAPPADVWVWAGDRTAPQDEATDPSPATLVSTLDLRRPAVSPAEYVSTPWLAEGATAAAGSAVILRKADPAATPGRLPAVLLPNERVYVNMAGAGVRPGDSLVVVRAGRHIGPWGRIMEPLAVLRVDTVWTGELGARVTAQFGEARVGDAVLPLGAVPVLAPGEPEPVASGPAGTLLEFLAQEPLYGTTDLAFISVGRSSGVGIGDEFEVYVPAAGASPASHVGVVRVVKVGDRTSTARVVSVASTALGAGLSVRMIRKVP
ncbi:MAG TPA: LysM peptidoglycan-binding domain-containing protein [Longimicrobiales bacterium]|nr:LysM peptidoglycan-binding domain-containing protein [Longimicrobiales bacterium]